MLAVLLRGRLLMRLLDSGVGNLKCEVGVRMTKPRNPILNGRRANSVRLAWEIPIRSFGIGARILRDFLRTGITRSPRIFLFSSAFVRIPLTGPGWSGPVRTCSPVMPSAQPRASGPVPRAPRSAPSAGRTRPRAPLLRRKHRGLGRPGRWRHLCRSWIGSRRLSM